MTSGEVTCPRDRQEGQNAPRPAPIVVCCAWSQRRTREERALQAAREGGRQEERIRGFTQHLGTQFLKPGGFTILLKCFGDTAFNACTEKKGGSVTSFISADSIQLSLAISVFREDTL